MFSLHETMQRWVCRVAFVACAVVPTVLTLGFVVYALRPWRETDWQRTLAQHLHVRIAVEQVVSPRPGVTRLQHVRLSDLRSGQPLGSLDEVQVCWRGGRLVLSTDELRIEAGPLSAWATTVATWLATDALPGVELEARRLAIADGVRHSLTLTNLRLHGEGKAEQGNRLAIQADLSRPTREAAATAPRLLVERKADVTIAMLDTGSARLPAWLLVDLLPSLSRCHGATFRGSLRVQGDTQAVGGSLRGQFENVALDRWIGPDSRHRLQGVARVELDQLSWSGPRVETAHGRLHVDGGAASRSLLAEAEKRLFCLPGPRLGNLGSGAGDQWEAFDELACSFHLTDAGLTIAGLCGVDGPPGTPGCVLAVEGQPLLWEPRYANLPVAQLVQVLAQPAASWLPASVEAHEMAGKLPLPSSLPKAEVAARQHDSTSPPAR